LEWIILAVFSAALFGLITAIEKRIIDHHLPNLGVYYASIAFSLFIPAVIVFLATGVPDETSTYSLVMATLSGSTWGVGLAMVFWGYKLEEASRASAIVHTFPVFVAIVALFWLDETLVPGQWAAIIVIVAGAFVISIRRSDGRGIFRLSQAFPILICGSLLTALSHLFAKSALDDHLTVWMTYSIRAAAMGVAFAFLAKPAAFVELLRVLRNWRTLALILIADFLLAPVASISLTRATGLGAISLVAAVAATRPFFVFMVSTFFSIERIKLLNEPLERDTLALKVIALVMIVGGIATLSLL
jgi:drug/metabolite transporter (DMT)-like permease|tara:strand:- start:558 stop:1463 length:906 start_codon:yes stop_codon:yes gene_type:complete